MQVGNLPPVRNRLQLSEFLLPLPDPQQDENQCEQQDECGENQDTPGLRLLGGEEDHFMFDQVARQNIQKTLRDQSKDGPQQVGAGGDIAQRKAEIDQAGGKDIDCSAEDHRPEPVFPDALIDPADQFFLAVTLFEIGRECRPDHEV